jgi:hypothetical protein
VAVVYNIPKYFEMEMKVSLSYVHQIIYLVVNWVIIGIQILHSKLLSQS